MTEKIIDELMDMARECGLHRNDHTKEARQLAISQFTNAILERAAIQFKDDDDWRESRYTGHAVSAKIRSLKLPTN